MYFFSNMQCDELNPKIYHFQFSTAALFATSCTFVALGLICIMFHESVGMQMPTLIYFRVQKEN